jgi:DNA repair exonuclease SbcCD nuclease subunit
VHLFSTRSPESVVLEELGVAIHGQGFATRSVTDDLAGEYPLGDSQLFNIGLLHTSLDGRPGHETYAPCTLDGLRSRGYRYWALGHVHKREVVAEDPWIVFPGNLQGRHARETGPKGCSLVTVEDGRVQQVEFRPLDLVRWVTSVVDLTGAGSLAEVYERVSGELTAALGEAEGRFVASRIRLAGSCPVHAKLRADREQLVNECRALASGIPGNDLWVEKVVIDTRPRESEATALARDDAFGGLLRSIRDLELDPQGLSDLAGELTDLAAKLPVELRAGEDAFDPMEPAVLRDCLDDVKELLLERLLRQGGAK